MFWLKRKQRKGALGEREALFHALAATLDGDLAESERLLARLVREDSERIEVYLLLARLYRRRGEIGRAIRIHQNLLLRPGLAAPSRVRALRGLALDFQRGGFLRRAHAAWRDYLRLRPRDREGLAALARIAADLHEFKSARALTRKVAKLEGRASGPDECELLLKQARAAQIAERESEAARLYARALRADPKSMRACLALAEFEAARGRNKQALQAFEQALALGRPLPAAAYPKLEAVYRALSRAQDYPALLRRLRSAQPQDPVLQIAWIEHLASAGRGDPGAALQYAARAIDRAPDSLPLHAARARILLAEGRDSEAAKALGDMLRLLEASGRLGAQERLE